MIASELRQLALRRLSRREYSRLELYRILLTKSSDESLINEVLQTLIDKKLLNEDRFIESYIHSRRNRGYGPLRIQLELQTRGIDTEQSSLYLKKSDSGWKNHLQTVHQKRFGKHPPKDLNEKARQIRFLQHRGFELEHIYALINNSD